MREQAKLIAQGLWEANQELAEEVAHEIYELRDEEPMPKLEADAKVFVWDIDENLKHKRHFSHFYNGKIFCYEAGRTSWSADISRTTGFENWELIK